MDLAITLFHWFCFLMTLPFALFVLVRHDPHLVKEIKEKSGFNLPSWVIGVWAAFRHLTFNSLLWDTGYFAFKLLQDHGAIEAGEPDLLFTTILNVALVVSFMFWGLLVTDIELVVDPAELFRGQDLSQPWVKWVPFQMAFGPPVKGKECEHGIIREIQRVLHAYIPMCVVAEAIFVEHKILPWREEVPYALGALLVYLSWNFFCWWILKIPGYPVQKRLSEQGTCASAVAYVAFLAVGAGVSYYSRSLRAFSNWESLSDPLLTQVAASIPLAIMFWSSRGFRPFRRQLAQCHGIDPSNIWGPEEGSNEVEATSGGGELSAAGATDERSDALLASALAFSS